MRCELASIPERTFTARRRREWICRRQIAEQSERRDERHWASEHKRFALATLLISKLCLVRLGGYEPHILNCGNKKALLAKRFLCC